MKIYIHHDTGCAYRINEAGAIEFRPLSTGNEIIGDEDIEWCEVDYEAMGSEPVKHERKSLSINELAPIIREALK